jgi:hypothetical protein
MTSWTVKSFSTLSLALILNTGCEEEPAFDDVSTIERSDQVANYPDEEPSPEAPLDTFNDAVSDQVSGLMWMRCEQGLSYSEVVHMCVGEGADFEYCHSQDNACNGESDQGELADDGGSALVNSCSLLNEEGGVGGFTNWRVPTADELAVMFETLFTHSAEELPNTQPSWVWSSTSDTNRNALIVSFISGEIQSYPKSGRYPVRCVRGF